MKKHSFYVHDLGLFETVQILEDRPAVLSLGKVAEEHGKSCEWVSGQKPQMITKEKNTFVQNGLIRSSCRSRSILQHWYKFIFNIVFTGLVIHKSRHRTK